jgi:THO complex subunit 2
MKLLEPTLLEEIGLVANAKGFHTKIVRFRTAQLYTQNKFNLLREESEGYSKLIVLFAEYNINGVIDPHGLAKNVLALIGTFDLDPNRVIDIFLDAFESRPLIQAFDALIKEFKLSSISTYLGLKFQRIYEAEQSNSKSSIPLARAAAVLISNEFVRLEELYPFVFR